jgi:hypothetical protein
MSERVLCCAAAEALVAWCCAELHDLLPGILPQLGADNMNALRKLAEEGYGAGAGGFGRGGPGGGVTTIEEEDEDDGAQPQRPLLMSTCVAAFSETALAHRVVAWLPPCLCQ